MSCIACFLPNDPPALYCTVCSFWIKVDQRGWDECWPWLGALMDRGYGKWRGKYAHRVAYALWNEVPVTDQTLHTCDTKPCCNPHHLYDGSHLDNVADALDRHRYRQGETHYTRRLR